MPQRTCQLSYEKPIAVATNLKDLEERSTTLRQEFACVASEQENSNPSLIGSQWASLHPKKKFFFLHDWLSLVKSMGFGDKQEEKGEMLKVILRL